jgi:hypothetical protein
MGAAAYNRGSRAIRARFDRELAAKRTRVRCPGRMGHETPHARCGVCHCLAYELNEGDRCPCFHLPTR